MTRHEMGFSVMWRGIYRISTLNIGFMSHFANIGEENTFFDGGETLLLLLSPSDLKLFAKLEMTIEKIIPSALLRICFFFFFTNQRICLIQILTGYLYTSWSSFLTNNRIEIINLNLRIQKVLFYFQHFHMDLNKQLCPWRL